MPDHAEAVAAFKELEEFLGERAHLIQLPATAPFQCPPDVNARESLLGVADIISADAQKFTLLFMNTAPSADDALGLCKHCRKGLDQFLAWCSATAGDSVAMHRAVATQVEEILSAYKRLVRRTLELNLQREPEAELVGAVMHTVIALKKLPKNQAAAVQKQLLRDAAAVKSVINDVTEMIEENTDPDLLADSLDDLGVDSSTRNSHAAADDIMNMDVTLSNRELQVARAGLEMAQACMTVLKIAVKGITPFCDGSAPPNHFSEDLAQASSIFTRAAEDLGALTCFDQSACKEQSEKLLQGLLAACVALSGLLGSIPDEVQQAVSSAQAASNNIP